MFVMIFYNFHILSMQSIWHGCHIGHVPVGGALKNSDPNIISLSSNGTLSENIDVFKHRYIEKITSMSKTIVDIEKKYRYIGIVNIAQAQEIFYNLFPNFEVRMTYNTRFKDKLQREQKHRHRNFIFDILHIDID